MVFQDPLLLAGNLYENIAFGRDGVTREAVLRAADLAQVTAFASELPGGFDTPIGERGVRLSGGQKQRVALARALVRDPKILLLDEATSALDPESEHLVQGAMEAVTEGRTTVVIAHRLSTIRGADLIVFLRNGQVVEAGTHAELLARSGEYARFHGMQFGDAEGA
ncbi:MAG: ATP-binding cassette domain-containing protein [Firmicutes bacterium]|nr:ATP-binding cassette domain-containing protein [Bacillota bacterium]